jgi:hypothetical protein
MCFLVGIIHVVNWDKTIVIKLLIIRGKWGLRIFRQCTDLKQFGRYVRQGKNMYLWQISKIGYLRRGIIRNNRYQMKHNKNYTYSNKSSCNDCLNMCDCIFLSIYIQTMKFFRNLLGFLLLLFCAYLVFCIYEFMRYGCHGFVEPFFNSTRQLNPNINRQVSINQLTAG